MKRRLIPPYDKKQENKAPRIISHGRRSKIKIHLMFSSFLESTKPNVPPIPPIFLHNNWFSNPTTTLFHANSEASNLSFWFRTDITRPHITSHSCFQGFLSLKNQDFLQPIKILVTCKHTHTDNFYQTYKTEKKENYGSGVLKWKLKMCCWWEEPR